MKLDKIKMKLAKILCELSQIKTDNGIIEFDGEELLTGITVYVITEDGNKETPKDGDYTTEDNKVITIVNGKIEKITETKEEEVVEEETKEETKEEEVKEEVKAEEEEVKEDVVEDVKEDVVEKNVEIEELKKEIDELRDIVNKIMELIEKNNTNIEEKFSKIEKMSASLSAQEVLETSSTTSKIDTKVSKSRELFKEWRSK